MLVFDSIPGLVGRYESSAELVLTGTKEALDKAKTTLTLRNYPVIDEMNRLQRSKPRTAKHAWFIKTKLEELKDKVTITMWAQIDDEHLSCPPGYYYLCENRSELEYSNENITPVFMGYERYYQKDIIEELLKRDRASIQACTGSGKSVCIAVLCKSLVAAGHRVLVTVPSIELLKQTYFPLKEVKDLKVSMLGNGEKPTPGCDVLVSTAQSAINEADKYSVVIHDEGHRAACQTWQDVCIAAIAAKKMYVLTASPERADKMSDLIWAWCGPVVYRYTAARAIKDGYIVPLEYHQLPVKVTPEQSRLGGNSYIKQYIALHSLPQYVATVKDLVTKALAKKKRILVLYKSVECCKALAESLGVDAAHGGYRAPFYAFKKGETDLCIANVNLLGEGIDVPSISVLIYCAGTSSPVTTIQAFGRAVRKCEGKDKAVVIDVFPDTSEWRWKAKQRAYIAKQYDPNSLDNDEESPFASEDEE